MKTKCLIIGVALATVSSAWALSFKANIPNNPVPKLLSTGKLPAITNSTVGETTIRVKRMCGDGDVAHYSSERPDFKFVAQSTEKIKSVVGVWVTEEGSLTPNARNWIPVGYADLTIPMGNNNDYIVQSQSLYLPVNHGKGATANASKLVGPAIYHLANQAQKSYGSSKNYKIYAGLFVCHAPAEGSSLVAKTDPSYKLKPGPVDIVHSLTAVQANNGVHKLAKDFIDNAPEIGVDLYVAAKSRVKVDIANGSYELKIDEQSLDKSAIDYDLGLMGEEVQGQAFDLAKSLLKLDYPAVTGATAQEQLNSYKAGVESAVGSSAFSKLKGLADLTSIASQVDSCSMMGLSTDKNSPKYDWENFPLNLSCKYLFGQEDKTGFAVAHTGLFNPSSVPSASEFKSLKKALALRLYTGALVEASQKAIRGKSELAVERPNCFIANSAGTSYINEIVYASPIKFSLHPTTNKWVVGEHNAANLTVPSAHPESLYALNDYVGYEGSKDMSVFGMAIDGKGSQGAVAPEKWTEIKNSWGISLPLAPLSDSLNERNEFKTFDSSSMEKAINIDVRIRSVGGSCTMFC